MMYVVPFTMYLIIPANVVKVPDIVHSLPPSLVYLSKLN